MEFRDILDKAGLEARRVLIFRHRPREPELRRTLPWLAAARPDLFNAYQQTQGPRVEKALSRAAHVAAFIGLEPGRATFAGFYEHKGSRDISARAYRAREDVRELAGFGLEASDERRARFSWFDLEAMETYRHWIGRLEIAWPGLERSWWRWADRNVFEVLAIHGDGQFADVMPEWRDLVLSWRELRLLPPAWAARLAEWRGVYLIHDRSDGRGYVGSAAGEENLLGRWRDYGASGHGGNRGLKARDPDNFAFSILELVGPSAPLAEVQALEASWKARLHTRAHGLNEN